MIYGFDEGQVLVIRPVKVPNKKKQMFEHKYTIEVEIQLDPQYRQNKENR